MMMRITGLTAFLALSLAVLTTGSEAAERRPNIVVLVADDLGYSDLGSYGSEIATPNLDALAREGVRFSSFHVAASCSPTRSMLLTGVDNHRNGVGNMRETIPREHLGRPGYLSVLNDAVVTVATLLRDGGYHTYAAGKWHLGTTPNNLPDRRGFERSFVQGDSGCDNWEPHRLYLALTDKVYWFEDGNEAPMPADYYSSRFFTDKAIEYIGAGATADKPFFAYIAYQANHIPLQAPAEFVDHYKGIYDDGWTELRKRRRDRAVGLGLVEPPADMVTMPTTRDWEALSEREKRYQARRMEVYAGMAEAMDFEIGRLIEYLRKIGAYENTVFLFLSDNGSEASDPYAEFFGRLWLDLHYSRDLERLGGKGAYSVIGPSWASAAASPLATYKFYAGEGGLRVPLIIAHAPGARQGRIETAFAHVTDMVPTILELAGVERPNGTYKGSTVERLTGSSLMPVLRAETPRVHALDESVGYELSGNAAVFRGDFKIVKNLPPIGDGEWHLYNVALDAGEVTDMRTEMPDLFESMKADYAEYAERVGVLPMPEGYQPARQIALNSLFNVYLPRLRALVPRLAAAAAALALLVWLRRRR